MNRIAIASDHAGFEYKALLIAHLGASFKGGRHQRRIDQIDVPSTTEKDRQHDRY